MTTTLDEEIREDVASAGAFVTAVSRLSRLSVERHFDAYTDLGWEAVDMQRVELRRHPPSARGADHAHPCDRGGAAHLVARHVLRHTVPGMNAVRRRLLAVTVPLVLGVMTRRAGAAWRLAGLVAPSAS